MQKKGKTDGVGVGGVLAGRRRKAFLVGSISVEILEDNTTIWGRGALQGSKKKTHPETAEVCRHSGPYRKVTFERTIARLSGHICWMNEA